MGAHGQPVRRRRPGGGDPCGARAAGRRAAPRGPEAIRAHVREHDLDAGSARSWPTSTGVSRRRQLRSHGRERRSRTSTRPARPHGRRRRKAALAAPRRGAGDASGWRPRRRRACASCRRATRSSTAQLAGVMAAKRTAELIPLCHPLPLSHIDVVARGRRDGVEIMATAETMAQTGVEMEALTAASRRGADGLRHGEGDRQGDGDRGRDAAREDEGARVRAAVLTVSDGVSAGTREDRSGDLLEELLEARVRGRPAGRAGRARRDRRRDRRARRRGRARADDGRNRPRRRAT